MREGEGNGDARFCREGLLSSQKSRPVVLRLGHTWTQSPGELIYGLASMSNERRKDSYSVTNRLQLLLSSTGEKKSMCKLGEGKGMCILCCGHRVLA